MKRPFRILCLTLFVLMTVSYAYAAPAAAPASQEQQPVIAQPAQDATVRGVVQVVGTAVHSQFQRYELYYAPYPVPSDQSWIFIGDVHTNQQPLGLLGTWDSRSVPDGAYALRVRVVKVDGNYIDSSPLRVLVANTGIPETPTPEASPTTNADVTEEPFVPAQEEPTPTVQIEVPNAETATPEPTPTLGPEDAEPTTILPESSGSTGSSGTGASGTSTSGASDTTSDVESITDQLFNGPRLIEVAKKTATYTLVAFAAVGAFFAVKWVLAWLWQKIRP